MVLKHLAQLGLQVNWEKSKLLVCAEHLFSWYEVRLGHNANTSFRRPCSISAEVLGIESTKQWSQIFSRVSWGKWHTPLNMHVLLQHWLHARVLRWEWHCSTHHVAIILKCHCTFSLWLDLSFRRSAIGTSVQMCYNRCIQDRLGHHVQRECSVRVLRRYGIGSVHSFFQESLKMHLSASTFI